jgi:hypothetical protein
MPTGILDENPLALPARSEHLKQNRCPAVGKFKLDIKESAWLEREVPVPYDALIGHGHLRTWASYAKLEPSKE